MTPAQIKSAVDGGTFENIAAIGDKTDLIALNGTMGDAVFNGYKVRCATMDFDNGHPIFMVWENESGVPICLASSLEPSPTNRIQVNAQGICMNRKGQVGNTIDATLDEDAKLNGPNKGGWEKCYCRITLMPQFKALLPKAWQDIIIASTVWTDNVGNGTDNAASVTSTTDYCFLPDQYELIGAIGFGNQYCPQKQKQWAYPKAGNNIEAFRHNKLSQVAIWFARGPLTTSTYTFSGIGPKGVEQSLFAAWTYGLRPCFRV